MLKLFTICCIWLLISMPSYAKELFTDTKSYSSEIYLKGEDSKGNLWFIYKTKGVLQFDGKKWWIYSLGKDYLYNDLFIDKKDNILVSIGSLIDNPHPDRGIYTIKNNNLTILYNRKNISGLDFYRIYYDQKNIPYFLMEPHDGRKYLIYTIRDNQWFKVNKEFHIPEDIGSLDLFIDSKNRKWFSFGDNITMIDPNDKEHILDGEVVTIYYFNSMSLPDDNSRYTNQYKCKVLYEDKKGNIWARANNALAKYDKNNHWTYYTRKDGIEFQYDIPVNIVENKKDELLVSSANGILKFSNDKFQSYYPKFFKFDTNQNKGKYALFFEEQRIMAMALDKDDTLWLSTFYRLEKFKNGKLKILLDDINPGGKGHYIESIYVDKHNFKWFTYTDNLDEYHSPLLYYDNKYWHEVFDGEPFELPYHYYTTK